MTVLLLVILALPMAVSQRIQTIPLVPHHVQKARRRLLLVETTKTTTTNENEVWKNDDRGHGQQHRRRAGQGEAENKLRKLLNRSNYPNENELWMEFDRSHYHRHRHRRGLMQRSAVEDDTMQVSSLYQGYGTHYCDLWVGEPPSQRQTVIVDTGSGVTAFPCVGCDDCGVPKYHIDELFDPAKSSTFEQLSCSECLRGHCSNQGSGCQIGMSYQEGSSWQATEVRDYTYVGGLHTASEETGKGRDDLDPFHAYAFRFPLSFGCQTKLTGLFKTQLADGIMGMDVADAAFWAQMSHHLTNIARKFSLCYSRSPIASREGTNAGAMTLGGYDERLHPNADLVYAQVRQGSGFYGVTIRQVYLRPGGGESALDDNNGKLVPILKNGQTLDAIVDSGTTDTYFTRSLATPFQTAWKNLAGKDYTHTEQKLTVEELTSYPTIIFQIQGDVGLNKAFAEMNPGQKIVGMAGDVDPENPYDMLLAMPASHYYEYDDSDGTYTARFYMDEGGSGSVLGANAMMGHDVFFDVDGHRIGWAESNCDYEALVKPFIADGGLEPVPGSSDVRNQHKTNNDGVPQKGPIGDMDGVCSSATCRFLVVVAGFLVVIAGVLAMLSRRAAAVYHIAEESELELRAAPSSDSGGDDFAAIGYRDHPASASVRSSPSEHNSRKSSFSAPPSGVFLIEEAEDDAERESTGIFS